MLLQILFENRKKEDTGNDCLLSIDGTDIRIALPTCKRFYSKKSKKSALRYEVGLCVKTGEICWVNGGYPPGEKNDNVIFQDALLDELEEGERVETDMGYNASAPKYVKCPGTIWTEAENKEMQMKSWNILVAPYRHSVYQHQRFFSGCCGAHLDCHSKW